MDAYSGAVNAVEDYPGAVDAHPGGVEPYPESLWHILVPYWVSM